MSDLGRLQRVDLRDIWQNEAQDFTPWLIKDENIALLSEAIGLGADGLTVVDREVPVGPFFADVLCEDTTQSDGRKAVIENQLTKSDHDHLGKAITYASGLNAHTLIVVAQNIRKEHRTAFEWLNDISKDDVNFFAVEIELWKIGDSLAAPKFEVVVAPDDWARAVRATSAARSRHRGSDRGDMFVQYWTAFKERFNERAGSWTWTRQPRDRNYFGNGIGRTNFELNAVAHISENWIRVELTMYGADAASWINLLKSDLVAIEEEFGGPLRWDYMPNRTKQHIQCELGDVEVSDREAWPDQHDWLIEKLKLMHVVFSKRVKTLDAANWKQDD